MDEHARLKICDSQEEWKIKFRIRVFEKVKEQETLFVFIYKNPFQKYIIAPVNYFLDIILIIIMIIFIQLSINFVTILYNVIYVVETRFDASETFWFNEFKSHCFFSIIEYLPNILDIHG